MDNLTNETLLEDMTLDFALFSLKRKSQNLSYEKLWQIWVREV